MARNITSTDGTSADDQPSPLARRRARRRQVAFEVLLERVRPTSVDDLAAAVADRGVGSGDSGAATDRLRTALRHADLPALDDAALVAYDSDRNVATPAVERPQRHR
jgi:hypothetical protein